MATFQTHFAVKDGRLKLRIPVIKPAAEDYIFINKNRSIFRRR